MWTIDLIDDKFPIVCFVKVVTLKYDKYKNYK